MPFDTPPATSILIAEASGLLRDGIAAICLARPDFHISARCDNGTEALEVIRATRPDVALLDVRLSGTCSLDIVRLLRQEGVPTRFVLVAPHVDDRMVFDVSRAGAHGLVAESEGARRLLETLEVVARGGTYIAPPAMETNEPVQDANGALRRLSLREQQVFAMLVEGVRAKEIAARLELSPKTVDTYRSGLMRKLAIHDIAGLVKFAVQQRLVVL